MNAITDIDIVEVAAGLPGPGPELANLAREKQTRNRRGRPSKPPRKPPALAVSVKDAAALLNVSTRTIHNRIAARKLRCHRVGGRALILYDELRRYVASLPEMTPE